LHVLYQLPIVCPDAGADSVGFDALASKPDAFAAQIKRELASWRAVIQDAKSKHPRRRGVREPTWTIRRKTQVSLDIQNMVRFGWVC
jgi:hypothetical protein